MRRTRIALALIALVVLAAGLTLAQVVKKGKTRSLETKTWMKTINGPHCSSLAKLMKAGPADEKEWELAQTHAQMLSEAGYVLMADGRCPDAVWAESCKTLQESSAAVAKALAEKNTAAAQESFQKVLGSCKSCHAAHKK